MATVPVIRKLFGHARTLGQPVFHVIRSYQNDHSDIETTSAQTPAIAQANIHDMQNAGIACVELQEILRDDD